MKINILGASGSGVTTTGNALAVQLNIPYFDSDDYFWKLTPSMPFSVRENKELRNQKIKLELSVLKSWVLGGSIFQWGEAVFPEFDLIIFLWIPPQIRVDRIKLREFNRYGNIIYKDPERKKQFDDFVIWAQDYDHVSGIANRNIYAHKKWLATMNCPILEIIGDFTTDQRIELIKMKINELKNNKLLT